VGSGGLGKKEKEERNGPVQLRVKLKEGENDGS
jgi:hypothetical protein